MAGGKPLVIKADRAKTELVNRFCAGRDRIFREKFGADFTAALTKKTGKRDGAGNEFLVWHDYVAGTDLTDSNSVFRAKVTMNDGLVYVSWTPNLNMDDITRIYTLDGCTDIGTGAWETPINPTFHVHRSNWPFSPT